MSHRAAADALIGVATIAAAMAPQHWALLPLFGAAAVTGSPPLCAGAVLAAWWGAASGWTGWVGIVVACYICARELARLPRTAAWLAPLLLVGVVSGRQIAAEAALASASSVVPELLVLGTLGAGLWSLGRGVRVGWAVRLGLAGLVLAGGGRGLGVYEADGEQRLQRAVAIQAERLVLPGLIGRSQRLDMAALSVVPDSDDAAQSVGWRTALDLGWRPQHPEADIFAIAAELDSRGRGGEAERLLARYPREGAFDYTRATFERWFGERDGWLGGTNGDPQLEIGSSLRLDWTLLRDGRERRVFGLSEAAPVTLVGRAQAFEGDPSVEVRLDATIVRWVPALPLELGVLAAGPHTLQVTFDSDRQGPGGDRNVWVDVLVVGQ